MAAQTVLIVEDEEPIMNALVDKFGFEDFNVLKANDGEEGLKVALKEKPDIILLDIIMPKTDGLEMLRKLREDEWGSEVPVFMLTNLSDMHKISEAMQYGMSGYLVKSDWKLDDVVQKVRDKLDGK